MKASHRHELKDNELGHVLADAQSSFSQHKGLILGLLALVLVGGGGFGGYRAWQSNLENKAGALLAAGVVIEESRVQAPEPPAGTTLDASSPGGQVPGTYPTLQAKLEAQLPKFMEAADTYPATVAGQSARLHAAETLAQLGRTDDALKQLDLLAASKRPLMVNAARLAKASVQLRAGQYDAAIAVLKAARPEAFNAAQARPLFKAADLKLEGVKDPWLYEEGGTYYLLTSIALPTAKTDGKSHATYDIYNTGECVSATGLATSRDLDHWEWQGVVLQPERHGWDKYCRRLNSFVKWEGRYHGFYDGSASHKENYEEKTGLASSADLRAWAVQTPDGPALTSPHTSHSLRYLDAQLVGDKVYLYYETARDDDAHELRVFIAEAAAALPPR